MLFTRYPRISDPPGFRQGLIGICSLYNSNLYDDVDNGIRNLKATYGPKYSIFFTACQAMICLLTETSESKRLSSVNSLAKTIADADEAVLEGYDLDYLHDCQSILRAYPNNSVTELFTRLDFETALRAKQEPYFSYPSKARTIYIVQIPKTGFFSYIEHICLAIYASNTYALPLRIDTTNWLYPIRLSLLLPGYAHLFVDNILHSHSVLSLDKFRSAVTSSLRPHAQGLSRFKAGFYAQLLEVFETLLFHSKFSDYYSSILSVLKPAFFFRRGDKNLCESLAPSDGLVLNCLSQYDSVYLMSDDSSYVDWLFSARSSKDTVVKIRQSQGYHHGLDYHNMSSFWETIMQWSVMVRAISLHAPSDSNMALTAFFARSGADQPFLASKAFFQRPMILI